MRNVLVLRFSKHIAAALVLLVAAQMSEAAALPMVQQVDQQIQEQQPAPSQQSAQQPAPPAPAQPDATQSKPAADTPQAPAPAPAAQQDQQQAEPGFATRSQEPAPQSLQQPVGTAAGPSTRPSGVAGSRPSGAAIAPAKQKHVKAILIRVGLIIGGAAAVGAVVGLSKGSPSRP